MTENTGTKNCNLGLNFENDAASKFYVQFDILGKNVAFKDFLQPKLYNKYASTL